MTNIFIHVYLDEDVDVLIANLLRSRGFDATTAKQAGQLGRIAHSHQYSRSNGDRSAFSARFGTGRCDRGWSGDGRSLFVNR